MIYLETIADDLDTFRIERQKNEPDSAWYDLWIYKSNEPKWVKKFIADNENWIYWNLYPMLKKDPKTAISELDITRSDAKMLRKLIKKADKLGWFDGIKRVKEENTYEGFC